MKGITCPYLWNCGHKFKPGELSEFDFDFLKSAVKKKMTFMFIHCPKCKIEFQFDAVAWKATAKYPNPNLKTVPKEKKTIEELTGILKKSNVEIPHTYFVYLTGKKFFPKISIFSSNEDFKLYNLEELCEKINIDGKNYLTVNQLKGFARTLKEIIDETLKKEGEMSLTLTQLSNCLTIGCDNTRILFIDIRDNNSLWIFHQDGGDIERVSKTLSKIINRKK
jgi:hypothetical protein